SGAPLERRASGLDGTARAVHHALAVVPVSGHRVDAPELVLLIAADLLEQLQDALELPGELARVCAGVRDLVLAGLPDARTLSPLSGNEGLRAAPVCGGVRRCEPVLLELFVEEDQREGQAGHIEAG